LDLVDIFELSTPCSMNLLCCLKGSCKTARLIRLPRQPTPKMDSLGSSVCVPGGRS
jgi:hypothetical protein